MSAVEGTVVQVQQCIYVCAKCGEKHQSASDNLRRCPACGIHALVRRSRLRVTVGDIIVRGPS